ncbi:hypothetical protein PR048_024890 [Dryococelus australis]|uniref:Uncharacterized protein n=1 Tax=Dryococelus australis TaxID=614101 RepID=A0ABQ9GPU5_9NEOP|nr:hypothetical protein PR048_024890 [Dryococelus australis]
MRLSVGAVNTVAWRSVGCRTFLPASTCGTLRNESHAADKSSYVLMTAPPPTMGSAVLCMEMRATPSQHPLLSPSSSISSMVLRPVDSPFNTHELQSSGDMSGDSGGLLMAPPRPIHRLGNMRSRCYFTSLQCGAAVAQWLGRSPPTMATRVRYPAGSSPDCRMWESCWTMPLARGFSRGTPLPRPCILAPLHPRCSIHAISGEGGHLRVPAGKPVTRIVLPRPAFTPHSKALASNQGELGSIPDGIASGFSLVGSPGTSNLAFRHCSILTSLQSHRFASKACRSLRQRQIDPSRRCGSRGSRGASPLPDLSGTWTQTRTSRMRGSPAKPIHRAARSLKPNYRANLLSWSDPEKSTPPPSPRPEPNRVQSAAGSHPRFSRVGIVPDDAGVRWVFLGNSQFPPTLHSGVAPYSPRFTLIGSSKCLHSFTPVVVGPGKESTPPQPEGHDGDDDDDHTDDVKRPSSTSTYPPPPHTHTQGEACAPHTSARRYRRLGMSQSLPATPFYPPPLPRRLLLALVNLPLQPSGTIPPPPFLHSREQNLYLCKLSSTPTCSPPTKANRVQYPAGSQDFRKLESCRTMPLVDAFSQGYSVSLALSFRCLSILSSITLDGSQDLAVKGAAY